MNQEDQWLFKLSNLLKDFPENCWAAGGCLHSFLVGGRPKDIDIFSTNPYDTQYFLEKHTEAELLIANEYFVNFRYKGYVLQVIKRYQFSSMEDTIQNFDFTIVCAAYNKHKGLVCNDRFYLDSAQKRLVINNLPFPLATVKRALKYAARGYKICPVGLSELLKKVNTMNVDWENPEDNSLDFYPDGTPTFRGFD